MELLCCADLETLTLEFTSSATSTRQTAAEEKHGRDALKDEAAEADP